MSKPAIYSSDINILHVDDEPDFADVTADILTKENDRFTVETVTSAREGMDRFIEGDFDCIVSDYQMSGQNGIEFLKTIREDRPELPFILFTGKGSEEVASEAIAAGVTDYLQKQTGSEQYQLLANRIINAVEHQHAKNAYREIFEKVLDGIVIHEPDGGTIVDMNEQFAEIFGYNSGELLELNFERIHLDEPPYTVENAKRRIRQAINQGSRTFEWSGLTDSGEQVWVEVHLAPVRLHGTKRVLAVVRDITERKGDKKVVSSEG